MSHKHAAVLRSIFQDPLPANLQWREIESLLNNLGAEISPGHGARFKVVLNGVEGTLHHPHHGNTMSRQDLRCCASTSATRASALGYEVADG